MADLNLIQKIVLNQTTAQTTMKKVKNKSIIKSPDMIAALAALVQNVCWSR